MALQETLMMLTNLALIALTAAPAQADDISAELFAQTTPQSGYATGVALRVDAGAPFVSGEAFGYAEGDWMGRATVGVDLLGASDRFDLTAGAFLGSVGDWVQPSVGPELTAGFELSLGARVGPIQARLRRVDGFRGPLTERLTQNEARLGWVFADRVEVFGQYVNYNPRQDVVIGGFGAGARVRF